MILNIRFKIEVVSDCEFIDGVVIYEFLLV